MCSELIHWRVNSHDRGPLRPFDFFCFDGEASFQERLDSGEEDVRPLGPCDMARSFDQQQPCIRVAEGPEFRRFLRYNIGDAADHQYGRLHCREPFHEVIVAEALPCGVVHDSVGDVQIPSGPHTRHP